MGTIAWMAPELLGVRPKYSSKSDMYLNSVLNYGLYLKNIIYAFGMILWEIASRQIPYKGANADVVRLCVLDGQREEMPTGCPDGYVALIEECWDQDPTKRPPITQILNRLDSIRLNFIVCNHCFGLAIALFASFFCRTSQLSLSVMPCCNHQRWTKYYKTTQHQFLIH